MWHTIYLSFVFFWQITDYLLCARANTLQVELRLLVFQSSQRIYVSRVLWFNHTIIGRVNNTSHKYANNLEWIQGIRIINSIEIAVNVFSRLSCLIWSVVAVTTKKRKCSKGFWGQIYFRRQDETAIDFFEPTNISYHISVLPRMKRESIRVQLVQGSTSKDKKPSQIEPQLLIKDEARHSFPIEISV